MGMIIREPLRFTKTLFPLSVLKHGQVETEMMDLFSLST